MAEGEQTFLNELVGRAYRIQVPSMLVQCPLVAGQFLTKISVSDSAVGGLHHTELNMALFHSLL